MAASWDQQNLALRKYFQAFVLTLAGFLLPGVAPAQEQPPQAPARVTPTPLPAAVFDRASWLGAVSRKDQFAAPNAPPGTGAFSIPQPEASTPGAPRRITLAEAQEAAAANNPMAHLAQLGVDAAHQHTLETWADFFPKISATGTNFHFNKFMGEKITVQRPIEGGTVTEGLPLAGKDQTFVLVDAAQPVTPLFKLQQVTNIARADERLARAKAGMPVDAANVEKSYYGLLVAQRELDIAQSNADRARDKRLVASSASPAAGIPADSEHEISAEKELVLAESKVRELTVSLNDLLGFPEETELELVAPATPIETITLKEASDAATTANPEIVEAESNVAKAHAASKLSKLDYVPDVAVLGGYAYNSNALPLLPRDFSFIGVMGSYNLFDFGKREHTIKERNAQVAMAETALELTKAKVAGAVKSSYFEMDRSRQLSELAHRVSDALPIERVGYAEEDPDLALARAKVEVEMLKADLEYRQALAQLKTLMGKQ